MTEEVDQVFIDAFFEQEGDLTKTAEFLNIERRICRKHAIRLKEKILERAETEMALNAPKAVSELINVMAGGSGMPTSLIRMDAIKQVLDRAGIVKKDKLDVNINGNNAIFILPAKDSE